MEDTANISIWEEIDELIFSLFDERKKKNRDGKNEEECIEKIIYYLCKSDKMRICSHFNSIIKLEYNVIAEKKGIKKIKKLHDKIKIFESKKYTFQYLSDLFLFSLKKKKIISIYFAKKIMNIKNKNNKNSLFSLLDNNDILNNIKKRKIYNLSIKWFKELKNLKEKYLCWFLLLLYLIDVVPFKNYNDFLPYKTKKNYVIKNKKKNKIIIDDFVVDKHTKQGKMKTSYDFAIEGAKVTNESKYINKLFKLFYNYTKYYETFNDIPINKESELYELIVRAQLVCSSTRPDTYFAKDIMHNNDICLLKGPYLDDNKCLKILKLYKLKKKQKIPTIFTKIIYLLPDRWPYGIALGCRNNIIKNKVYPFLHFKSILSESQINNNIIIKNSKLWNDTKVLNSKNLDMHISINKLNDNEIIKSYIEALLFRYIFKLSDLADRNFLLINKTVISIDEDTINKNLLIYKQLKKNKSNIIYNWLLNRKNFAKLNHHKWNFTSEKHNDELHKIQKYENCICIFKYK